MHACMTVHAGTGVVTAVAIEDASGGRGCVAVCMHAVVVVLAIK